MRMLISLSRIARKIEGTVRYLGTEVEYPIEIAEKIGI